MRAFLRDNPFCVSRSHGRSAGDEGRETMRGIWRKVGAKNQFAFPTKFPIPIPLDTQMGKKSDYFAPKSVSRCGCFPTESTGREQAHCGLRMCSTGWSHQISTACVECPLSPVLYKEKGNADSLCIRKLAYCQFLGECLFSFSALG